MTGITERVSPWGGARFFLSGFRLNICGCSAEKLSTSVSSRGVIVLRRVRTVAALIVVINLIGYLLLPPGTPGTLATTEAAAGGPLLLAMSPADNATGVNVNSNLVLTFDEPVQLGTGSAAVTIHHVSDNSVFESFVTATSNRITISTSSPNVVTIDPSKTLAANTDYYVIIDAGAFRNMAGEDFAGLYSGTAWNFSTSGADTTAPQLVQYSQSVRSADPITLTFNETVYAASGTITITNASDSADIRTIPVISDQVKGSGTPTISILPSIPLTEGKVYRVAVPNTAFEDAAGNRYSGTTVNVTVTGSPLALTARTPADDATGVATGTNTLTMTFNRNVAKGASGKTVVIKNLPNNNTVYTIQVNSSSVTVNQNTVTVRLPGGLSANTAYYVLVDPGAFVDASNSSVLFSGITDASAWNFTTAPGNDSTRPTVVEFTPADNSVNASLSQTLKIKFSEPVYPGTGEIVIRNAQTDAVFASIPVTSDKVTGFGTDTISIQVDSKFVMNQAYYVQIGSQAFRDAAGNNYAGIADKTSWNFSMSQDSVPPTIASMEPAPGTMSVPLNQVFKLTFSEAVRFTSPSAADAIVIRGTRSNTAQVSTTAEIAADGKTLVITPLTSTPLQASTSYYVEIPAGIIEDMAGNDFGGILNEYTWSFGTIGSDKTAPTIQNAAVQGSNRIVLTYNEPLDENQVPPTGSFYVTANGIRLNVTGVQISGQNVILTLQTGVVYGQTIKLYYTRSTPAIQDPSGNQAANLTNYSVKNEANATLPVPSRATVSGNILTLIFNASLQSVNTQAYQQFRVRIGSSTYTPTAISGSNDTIWLTLPKAVTSGDSVYVSYTPGSHPLRDGVGNTISAFNNFPVVNALDNIPPALQSASVAGNLVTLTFNEPLDESSTPKNAQFVVTVADDPRTISSVSISGSTVTLTLSSAVTSGQTVKVSYLGGTPALKDLAGNSAAQFANYTVTNATSSVSPVSGSISGKVISISFNQTLSSSNLPSASQFTVYENGTRLSVSSVSVSGSTLRLEMHSEVKSDSRVTVSYLPPSSSSKLQTTSGIIIPAFTDFVVTNSSSGGDEDLGEHYETAPGGGINIKTSAATTGSRLSAGGRSAQRYSLGYTTVTQAFSLARSGGRNSRVTFTVPSSQTAAIVEVPIDAILNVRQQSNSAVFAVIYGDLVYELPLNALDQKTLSEWVQRNGPSGLLIEIDKGNASNTSSLRSALIQKRYSMVSETYAFTLSMVSGNRVEPITELAGFAPRTLTLSGSIDPQQHTVVWLEPETGAIAHIPSSMTTQGGSTTVTFKHKQNAAYALIRYNAPYTDIPANHWARKDLQLMLNRMIASGRTASAFEPDKPITRAEFAEFIVRGLGLEGDREAARVFRDVNASSDAAAYIGAAYKANIVAGVASDRFEPNSLITREQMASMMVRAARAAGVDILMARDTNSYLAPYTDRTSVSNWARTDLAKSIEARIISGVSSYQLGPKQNASRAQAAVMIKRLLEYVNLM